MERMCFLTNVLNQQSQWIKQSEEVMVRVCQQLLCSVRLRHPVALK